MTPRAKSHLSRALVIFPIILLLAAAASLALTSIKGSPFEVGEDILRPFFTAVVISLCVSFLGCGIAGKHFSNYANTASWVSTAATIEMIIGGLLVPLAVGFGIMTVF